MQINSQLPALSHIGAKTNGTHQSVIRTEPVAEFIPAPRRTVLPTTQTVPFFEASSDSQQSRFIRMLASLEKSPLEAKQTLPPAVLSYIQVSSLNNLNDRERLIDEMV